jgi:hypothetical protein
LFRLTGDPSHALRQRWGICHRRTQANQMNTEPSANKDKATASTENNTLRAVIDTATTRAVGPDTQINCINTPWVVAYPKLGPSKTPPIELTDDGSGVLQQVAYLKGMNPI